MARKRIIEGTWTCSSCETEGIKGRHKTCPACGNPREQAESNFDFGQRTASGALAAATVNDAAQLEQAAAGADWMCANCDASNPGNRDVCRTCAASRDDPFGEPVFTATAPPSRKKTGLAALLAVGTAAVTGAVGVVASCCGLGWYASDTTVEAQITGYQWVRQAQVQRLTPSHVTEWRDALPAPAGLPGSGALSAGLGELGDCETLACWPRPPEDGGVARVAARQWTRTIRTRRMQTSDQTGWRSDVPSTRGEMPRNNAGGRPGYDNLSCSSREKTPEQCRDEDYQEPCGTHEECSVRDLGNGFAEETCVDVQDYCTQTREVCTAAVMGEWCTWKALTWRDGQDRSNTGSENTPAWPLLSLGSDEVEERTEEYVLELNVLAGTSDRRREVPNDVFSRSAVGQLVYSTSSGVRSVPSQLQTADTNRHDCGNGIARDVLTTRDRCQAQVYAWVDEQPIQTLSSAGAPDWPDGQLGDNGRETRSEWMLVELSWERGNKPGHAVFKDSVSQWEAWEFVQSVPVVVDFDATYVSLDESYTGPVPPEVRPGRLQRAQ